MTQGWSKSECPANGGGNHYYAAGECGFCGGDWSLEDALEASVSQRPHLRLIRGGKSDS